jgi:hypothetical protein
MLGSTAAPPPSPHQDCPSGILDGEDLPPPSLTNCSQRFVAINFHKTNILAAPYSLLKE